MSLMRLNAFSVSTTAIILPSVNRAVDTDQLGYLFISHRLLDAIS